MTTRQADVLTLVHLVRKAPGFSVRTRGDHYLVKCPDGAQVTVPSTPGNVNSLRLTQRDLEAHGLKEALKRVEVGEAKRRARAQAEGEAAVRKAQQRAEAQAKALAAARMPVTIQGLSNVEDATLVAPQAFPAVYLVNVTPALAEKLLSLNTHNRPLREARISRHVNNVDNGLWLLTHQGIAVDSTGVLQDGQNRLTAIIRTGVTLPLFVFVGMDPKAFQVIDTHDRRTGADTLHLAGAVDINVLAAVTRLVWLHQHVQDVKLWERTRTENATLLARYERDKTGLAAACREAGTLAKPTGLSRTPLGAALYLIRKANRADHVDPWVEGLRTGENLSSGDPRLALIRWARTVKTERGRRHAKEYLAVILKAWNAHAEGRRMTVLMWRINETMPTVGRIA